MLVGIAAAVVLVAFVSYEAGQRARYQSGDSSEHNFWQATLAFAHYKSYERVKLLLEQKCYEAALKDVSEMKNLQTVLLSENLRATRNDRELVEYVRLRDPDLLKAVMAGHVPNLLAYDGPCTGPGCECK